MTAIRSVAPLPVPPLGILDPDAIRAAIDATDERAKLLRRLLRVAMRLRSPLPPDGVEPPAAGDRQERSRG